MMFQELFSVELDNRGRRADRPHLSRKTWHAAPSKNRLTTNGFQFRGFRKDVSRLCKSASPPTGRRGEAAQAPARHPADHEQDGEFDRQKCAPGEVDRRRQW